MVHVCYHTLAYSLLFLSNSFFFFLIFLLYFSLFFLFPCGVVMFSLDLSLLLFRSSLFPPSLPVHGRWPFYTACHKGFLLIYGCPSKPPTSLSTAQPPPLTCASRATPHYQTKSLILFTCSPWHFHLDKGGHSLSLSPMACT